MIESVANILPAVPPAFIYLAGAALLPLFGKGRTAGRTAGTTAAGTTAGTTAGTAAGGGASETARKIYLILLAAVGLVSVAVLRPQTSWEFPVSGFVLTFLHVDPLSRIMGYIFALIGAAAILYSLPATRENGEVACGLLYLGSALGAVFAGDFFTLYIFWEIMAFSSLGLIWYSRTERATNAGMRYILFHLFGGCALLAGIIINYMSTGNIAVGPVEPGLGYFLLLVGIGVNAAFIPLHTWLPDSYPKATIAGAVFMSVYTTKTGVYVLARTFPGVEAVAYIGGVMCVYGVVFALLQNDVRKLLSYHIISQVGYMVAGVGIGAVVVHGEVVQMGINGGIAHVFNHILYKALLFMCMGAVIFRTGKSNLTELGGLARKMPVTTVTCVIAALSISGVVGFNGYVSKGMIIHAAELKEMHILALALMLGSVGTFLSFLKLTYFTFFRRNEEMERAVRERREGGRVGKSGRERREERGGERREGVGEVKEAPLLMLIPMCVTAFLCVAIGVYPRMLYEILPYPADAFEYQAYSVGHTLGTIELLAMTGFMFFALRVLIMPHERVTYDIDYIYRKAGRRFIWLCEGPVLSFARLLERGLLRVVSLFADFSKNPLKATRMGRDLIVLSLLKPFVFVFNPLFHPVYKRYEQDLEEMKMRPVDEHLQKMSIGTGLLLVLLFFALYLIAMLLHRWLA
ncbi:MAG: Na(+)/H(+) antiporter subunit D [Candidatus Methanophagaceae archaeon]|nr:MAG: Na(+)/H(+) antiporter subunit D [Methanophagales archaeon]